MTESAPGTGVSATEPVLGRDQSGQVDYDSIPDVIQWFLDYDQRVAIIKHPRIEELFQWKQNQSRESGEAVFNFNRAEDRLAIGIIQSLAHHPTEAGLHSWIAQLLNALDTASKATEGLASEYSLAMNTLDSGLKLFMSREVKGDAGEDLVEKQNAEQGLMPVLGNEAAEYGYESQNRYFVQCFLDGKQPVENFHDGLEVTELLMTAYMSAEQERTIAFKPDGLDSYVPLVAQGLWKAR